MTLEIRISLTSSARHRDDDWYPADLDHDGIPDDKEPPQARAWERPWKSDQRNALLDGDRQPNFDRQGGCLLLFSGNDPMADVESRLEGNLLSLP